MTDTRYANYTADMNQEPWDAALACRLPALLTGPVDLTDNCIKYLRRRLPGPVVDVQCGVGVAIVTPDDADTVVFHDVDRLQPADQHRLLRWLEAPRRPQVISTSSRALFPLIAYGLFSEDLYYRLNSIYFDCAIPTSINLGTILGPRAWIDEFPSEVRVPAKPPVPVHVAVPPPKPAPALLPLSSAPLGAIGTTQWGRTRVALASGAFGIGVIVGAWSMWAVTTSRIESTIVPVASTSASLQERQGQPLPVARQNNTAVTTLEGTSAAVALSPKATTGQRTAVTVAVRRVVAQPRSTVFRGALAVNSRPAGAQVSINGRPIGVTPLVVNNLPAGSRVVRMTAQGYHPWSSAIRVVANQRNAVTATLQRLPE